VQVVFPSLQCCSGDELPSHAFKVFLGQERVVQFVEVARVEGDVAAVPVYRRDTAARLLRRVSERLGCPENSVHLVPRCPRLLSPSSRVANLRMSVCIVAATDLLRTVPECSPAVRWLPLFRRQPGRCDVGATFAYFEESAEEYRRRAALLHADGDPERVTLLFEQREQPPSSPEMEAAWLQTRYFETHVWCGLEDECWDLPVEEVAEVDLGTAVSSDARSGGFGASAIRRLALGAAGRAQRSLAALPRRQESGPAPQDSVAGHR
jgi:hypothetical protein